MFARSLARLRAPVIARSAVRPTAALPRLPLFRSYAVESPPPTPAGADAPLEQTLAPPDVQAAVADVEQSAGLQRLAADEGAQDVFRRFGAFLESKGACCPSAAPRSSPSGSCWPDADAPRPLRKGHDSSNPPTVDQFAQLVVDADFRSLLLQMKAVVQSLDLSEEVRPPSLSPPPPWLAGRRGLIGR